MSPTSSSYEHATREQSRRQAECLRRDLAVLVVDHLRQEAMFEAAEAVRERLAWDVDEFRVCDNVDLGLVLADFVNFYHARLAEWLINIMKLENQVKLSLFETLPLPLILSTTTVPVYVGSTVCLKFANDVLPRTVFRQRERQSRPRNRKEKRRPIDLRDGDRNHWHRRPEATEMCRARDRR